MTDAISSAAELPPLPKPCQKGWIFDSSQMRAYALEAIDAWNRRALLSASKPAALTIEQIGAIVFAYHLLGECLTEAGKHHTKVLRALLDASPAAPAQSAEPANNASREANVRDRARWFVRDFSRDVGFAMSDAQQEVMLNLFLRYAAPQPSKTAVVLDDERAAAAFEDWFDREYPVEYGGNRPKFQMTPVMELMRATWQARAASIKPVSVDERAAFKKALRETWQMVDPLNPPPAGSYYRGQHEGIIAALKTIRENFERAASPHPVAQPVEQTWALTDDRRAQIEEAISSLERAGFRHEPGNLRAFLAEAATAQPVEQTRALTDAARDVLAERERQISSEGWTPEHDDSHSNNELSLAAACYAVHDAAPYTGLGIDVRRTWPFAWDWSWWKPKDRRRNLIKAGALILAEIERIDRAAARPASEGDRE